MYVLKLWYLVFNVWGSTNLYKTDWIIWKQNRLKYLVCTSRWNMSCFQRGHLLVCTYVQHYMAAILKFKTSLYSLWNWVPLSLIWKGADATPPYSENLIWENFTRIRYFVSCSLAILENIWNSSLCSIYMSCHALHCYCSDTRASGS